MRSSAEDEGRRARLVPASCVVRVDGHLATRLRHEEVRATVIGRAQELDRRVPLAERALERIAPRESPFEGELRVARLQLLERTWDLKEEMRRARRLREPAGAVAVGEK